MSQNVDILIFERKVPKKNKNGLSNVDRIKKIKLDEAINDAPLVSCLMVTRGKARFIQSSIEFFLLQTYPNRELIIVYDNRSDEIDDLIRKYKSYPIEFIFVSGSKSLGELRNISVAAARGAILCQWDDDDVYHPERINLFVKILIKSKMDACFLLRWIYWDIANHRLSISDERPWEGSMFVWRDRIIPYPHLCKSEDFQAVTKLCKTSKIALIDNPCIYVYVVHGENTWDDAHMSAIYNNSSMKLEYTTGIYSLAQLLPLYAHPCLELHESHDYRKIFQNYANTAGDPFFKQINKNIESKIIWYNIMANRNRIMKLFPALIYRSAAEGVASLGKYLNIDIIKNFGQSLWRLYEFRENL